MTSVDGGEGPSLGLNGPRVLLRKTTCSQMFRKRLEGLILVSE